MQPRIRRAAASRSGRHALRARCRLAGPRDRLAKSASYPKLLKLVCLFALFELPDCAAEIVVAHRDRVATAVDPDALLDLLTPSLRGKQLSYADYVAAFDDDVESFYPGETATQG